jgi:hypothetical protein
MKEERNSDIYNNITCRSSGENTITRRNISLGNIRSLGNDKISGKNRSSGVRTKVQEIAEVQETIETQN